MAPQDAGGKPLGGFARAFAALRGRLYTAPPNTISGLNPSGWPTALQPVAPTGPKGSQPLAFSYYFGINQQITPRFDEPLTAAALRELATYPLARICIENVKDVLCTMPWSIQLKRKKNEPIEVWKQRKDKDLQGGMLSEFFEYPDGETPWGDWLRPILEDMLVIDGASILCQRTLSGKLVQLRWTDGADILRLIDDQGFTPQGNNPAYTQLWEGIPRLLLTADQLVYRPSNIVAGNNYSSKLYGNSITQQMAEEIRIGMARLAYVLAFYTQGGVPGLAQIIPPGVTPDKIIEAQQWLASDLSGQLAKRRGWRLIQGFVEPSAGGKDQVLELKDPVLADVFDDLHIRKIAFGYGVSAQRLLKQMNRASAEAGQDAAEKEGIQPRLKWLKGTMDLIIQRRMMQPDYEMVFDTDDELDVVKQETVDSNYVKTGQRTIDENRVARGLVPFNLPETKSPIIITATGVQPLEGSFDRVAQELDNATTAANKPTPAPAAAAPASSGGGGQGGAPKKAARLRKAAATDAPALIDTDKLAPTTDRYIRFMGQRLAAFFEHQAARIGKAWAQHAGGPQEVVKADGEDEKDKPSDNEDLERELLLFGAKLTPIQRNSVRAFVLLALGQMRWGKLSSSVQGYYTRSGDNGAAIGVADIERVVPEEDQPADLTAMQEASEAEIREFVAMRTAELVGMRRQADGSLIENPDAKWAISDTTREDLVKTVIQAVEEGWTVNQLAVVIAGSYTFSETRAKMVARTELARAQAFGNYITWHLTGLSIFVEWVTSNDEGVCPICDALAAQGVQPLGHEFLPFVEYPPAHPNCRCALRVVEDANGD